MSYSFSVRGANAAALVAAAAAQFDATVAPNQPWHAADRDAMLATVAAVAGVLPDTGEELLASVASSLGGAWTGSTMTAIRSCHLTVNVTAAAPASS